MKSRRILAGLMLGSAMLVGCEEQPEARPAPRQGPQGTSGTENQNQNAQVRAQALIDQVNRHIRAGDYDAAETSLRELESMKSGLPASMQTQITSLRTQVDNAKVGAGSTTPQAPPTTPQTPPTLPPDEPENP